MNRDKLKELIHLEQCENCVIYWTYFNDKKEMAVSDNFCDIWHGSLITIPVQWNEGKCSEFKILGDI